MRLPSSICCLAVGLSLASSARAGELVIGQCAALEGAASQLGQGMKRGLELALAEANAGGGVNGANVKLVSRDDGYEPEKAAACAKQLIEKDGAFALAGFVGTPTAKAALPVAVAAKVPLVGIFSGAMLLRDPVQRYVVNVRASYDDETEALVARLMSQGKKQIAVFSQNDAFGQAGLSGTEKALQKRGAAVAGKGTFERNTVAVEAGLKSALAASPDAVLVVAPYKPMAAFVRAARAAGFKGAIATVSFVGTESLIADLGAAADGVLISQVVPSPDATGIPIVRTYQQAMAKAKAELSYVSLEGFISGRVLVAAARLAPANPTREQLVDALEKAGRIDLGGVSVSFSPSKHQGSSVVWLTEVSGGKARPAGELAAN
jgi:ABC-type branched-subunit amino acid transport system substrate-binding protein